MRVLKAFSAVAPVLALLNQEAAKNAALDKVIDMLKTMEQKAKDEKQNEEVTFAGWTTFTENVIADAKNQISDLNMEIEKQQAQMEKQKNISKAAAKAMSVADQCISDSVDDMKAATKTRALEHEAFIAEQTELNDGIYACGKAIDTLDAVSGSTEAGAPSFVQMKNRLHSAVAALKGDSIAKTLLAQVEALADPFTAAHESKVGVVIEMVETLKKDFEKALLEATQSESNRKHNFDMTIQSLTSKKDNCHNELKSKTSEKGAADEAAGKATEAKAQAEKEHASTTKLKNATQAELQTKTNEYNARMKSRQAEMTAIAEAVGILEGGAMQSGSSNLDAAQKVGAFIQIKSKNQGNADKAVEFLKSKASSLHSKILMQLAEAASADPFAKVKQMIESLVGRLQQEAAEEAAKHGTCTKDMARDKANIEKDSQNISKYSAAKDKAEGDLADYNEQVKTLTEQLEKLAADRTEASKLRSEESAENNRVTEESTAAVKALEDAIAVLQDYYSKVALVQQPEYAGGEYKGVGGEGGVLGLLDVIKSDMTALKEETVAAEAAASESHANFMEDTESETKVKQAAKRTAKENAAESKNALNSASEDLAESKKQLKLDNELKKTTDDMCIAKGESFEEKTAKREAEIQSLKEALEILANM